MVENSFGILANKWRVYHRKLQLHPQQADSIVKATCVLHNYIRKTTSVTTSAPARPEPESQNAECNASLHQLKPTGNHSGKHALMVRERFKEYDALPEFRPLSDLWNDYTTNTPRISIRISEPT